MKMLKLKPFSSREDIIWASGLFEGEGWISIQDNIPAIGMQLSDKALLDRFSYIVGGGPIYFRPPRMYKYETVKTRKPQYAWRLGGYENCQVVIAYLWPWLSNRRRERAKQVLIMAKENSKRRGIHNNSRYSRGCRCPICTESHSLASKAYYEKAKRSKRSSNIDDESLSVQCASGSGSEG